MSTTCSPGTPTCSSSARCPKTSRLAGLRVGYGLASAPLVEALSRARPPFSVNVLALAAIEAGVASEAWRAMSVDRVRHERGRSGTGPGAAGSGVLPEPG